MTTGNQRGKPNSGDNTPRKQNPSEDRKKEKGEAERESKRIERRVKQRLLESIQRQEDKS
jgi:hypothetical protein